MPEKPDNRPPVKEEEDNDFWCESDEESFGEDSDGDMEFGSSQFPLGWAQCHLY